MPSAQNDLNKQRPQKNETDSAIVIQGGVNFGSGNADWEVGINYYPDSFNMSGGGIPLAGYQSNNNPLPDYNNPAVQHIFPVVGAAIGIAARAAVPKLISWVKGLFTRSRAADEGAAAESLTVNVAKGADRAVDRPAGIPNDWLAKETKKGGGTQYFNPNNPHDRVRVMPGNPNSPNSAQQGSYVKRQIDGKHYDAQGRVAPGDSPAAHIPLDQFKF